MKESANTIDEPIQLDSETSANRDVSIQTEELLIPQATANVDAVSVESIIVEGNSLPDIQQRQNTQSVRQPPSVVPPKYVLTANDPHQPSKMASIKRIVDDDDDSDHSEPVSDHSNRKSGGKAKRTVKATNSGVSISLILPTHTPAIHNPRLVEEGDAPKTGRHKAKIEKRKRFTPAEDELLASGIIKHGMHWAAIAKDESLGLNRSDMQIRDRFRTLSHNRVWMRRLRGMIENDVPETGDQSEEDSSVDGESSPQKGKVGRKHDEEENDEMFTDHSLLVYDQEEDSIAKVKRDSEDKENDTEKEMRIEGESADGFDFGEDDSEKRPKRTSRKLYSSQRVHSLD